MKLYEISLLCKDEEILAKISRQIKKLVQVKKEQNLGQRQLVYPIKKQIIGFLGSLWIEANEKNLTKLRRVLKQEVNLLRYLILSKLDWQMEDSSPSQKLEQRAKSTAIAKKPVKKLVKTKQEQPEKISKPKKTKTAIKSKTDKTKKGKKKTASKNQTENSNKRLKALDKKLKEILSDDKRDKQI